ncbi:hypothetical protein AAMO2058_000526300 [Amorphochlora amoebiformis]
MDAEGGDDKPEPVVEGGQEPEPASASASATEDKERVTEKDESEAKVEREKGKSTVVATGTESVVKELETSVKDLDDKSNEEINKLLSGDTKYPAAEDSLPGLPSAMNTIQRLMVNALIMPDEFNVTEEVDSLLTVDQLCMILCRHLSLPLLRFSLASSNGKPMVKDSLLTEWSSDGSTLSVVGTVSEKLDLEYRMPNVLQVMVSVDNTGHPVIAEVEVTRDDAKKRYFGGYRDKKTGREYHHACTQTLRKPRESKVRKYHRDTQTVNISSKSAQSKREQGTQMARKDLYIDTERDRIITSQQYFTTEELLELKRKKALAIQCFIRQCFAWRKVAKYYTTQQEKRRAEIKERMEREKLAKAAEEERVRRRMNPKTKADFDALYAELKAWRDHQEKLIKASGMSEPEIKAALKDLLHKEVKLLQTIDKLKIRARSENKAERTKANLELMASPKEWLTSQGDYVEVITPTTTRASELVMLYNGLKLRGIPVHQRLDILMNVKFTVKEFDCRLTREIQELVNRERDMLDRGRSSASLKGLRKRLEDLFLQFIETPEFNPGATIFQRVPYKTNFLTKIYPESSTALYSRKNP